METARNMSMQQRYYLRENVYFEPLVLKWYAWPYLLPPVSAAMIAARGLGRSASQGAEV